MNKYLLFVNPAVNMRAMTNFILKSIMLRNLLNIRYLDWMAGLFSDLHMHYLSH